MAGVSTTTVSKVLNGAPRSASETTKQKIFELAEVHQYRPNVLARSLVMNKSQSLGLILPDINNPFFSGVARGLEDAAYQLGYQVFVCNTDNRRDRIASVVKGMLDRCVDGIISCSDLSEDLLTLIFRNQIPLVEVDRIANHLQNDPQSGYGVMIDGVQGGRLAAEHLLSLGHRNIACITGNMDIPSVKERLKGFEQTLNAQGVELRKEDVYEGDFTLETGLLYGKKILKNSSITAIFAMNDIMAFGAIKAAANMGIRTPQDISIIGFDDIPFSTMILPALTTIHQPIIKIGEAAFEIMNRRLQGTRLRKKQVVMESSLIVRDSTGPVPTV